MKIYVWLKKNNDRGLDLIEFNATSKRVVLEYLTKAMRKGEIENREIDRIQYWNGHIRKDYAKIK